MRTHRIIGEGTSYYHVMSRTTGQSFLFHDVEKECFCLMMHRLAKFSGIRILTFCVMDNHFHILLEVPDHDDESISDDEICHRMRFIYDPAFVDAYAKLLEDARKEGCGADVRRLRNQYLYRMENLSEYMKALKQRFSIWYNKTHDRKGTLWEERFRSILIEPPNYSGDRAVWRGCSLMIIAAYIDMNPLRAGIAENPAFYRWCGYARAVSGNGDACFGIKHLVGLCEGGTVSWFRASDLYKHYLHIDDLPDDVREIEKGIQENRALEIKNLLRCHVRYFNDGLVIGSRLFVDHFFLCRKHMFGAKRRSGARRIKGYGWDRLCTFRDLKKDAISIRN